MGSDAYLCSTALFSDFHILAQSCSSLLWQVDYNFLSFGYVSYSNTSYLLIKEQFKWQHQHLL